MEEDGYIDGEFIPHLYFFESDGVTPRNRNLVIPKDMPTWVSFGGGTDSTAMLCGLYEKGIKVDRIVFADTGGERKDIYDHVDTFSKWLVSHGMPKIETVQKVRRNGELDTLEGECLRKKTLPSLAFGFKKCSLKFKAQPQEKAANNWPVAKECWKSGGRVTKLIGYDCGEIRRARPPLSQDGKYLYLYPLICWMWNRAECLAVMERHGIKKPGKSSCFFCPAMKKSEILSLSCSLKQRALRIEKNATENLKSVKGLGRNFSWAEFLAKPEQGDLFKDDGYMAPCDCYDGG